MNWMTRTDHQTAEVIQRAIGIELAKGSVAAWVFLSRNQIPEMAIARILHGQRRSCTRTQQTNDGAPAAPDSGGITPAS